jgi:ABC-2 type transport system permease protein
MLVRLRNIRTVALRYFYVSLHDFNKIIDFLYWPLLDILLYGFIGISFADKQHPTTVLAFLTALVLWQVVYRANLEISRNIVQELWDNNLINLLTTPLTVGEWMSGLMFTGLVSTFFTVPFGALAVYLIYGYNVFSIGVSFLLFATLLIMSGWILGLIGSSFLIWGGQRIETIVWAVGWLPAPFCSVYYPLSILPGWMQLIGNCLPMTYVFEAMRLLIREGILSRQYLMIALCLNIFYCLLFYCFFNFMLNKSKDRGLTKL